MHSVDELDQYLLANSKEKVFLCGGGEIYKLFFDLRKTDEVILSRVKMQIEDADAFFPEFEVDFQLTKTDERDGFTIEYWKRK